MSNKMFFGILATIVVVVLGLALYFNNSSKESNDTKPADLAVVTENDHTIGNEEAKVILVEYADFQCPYCGAVHPTIKEVMPEYEDDVLFVFRHFPITSIHPNALVAHKAAEAASKQDKFWEMHDKLFETQTSWSSSKEPLETFRGYAKDLKLDMDKFNSDFDATSTLDTINKVKSAGSAAGVESTPTMFLNGKKIDAPRSPQELRATLDKALKETN